jgi:hypothetical protein
MIIWEGCGNMCHISVGSTAVYLREVSGTDPAMGKMFSVSPTYKDNVRVPLLEICQNEQ